MDSLFAWNPMTSPLADSVLLTTAMIGTVYATVVAVFRFATLETENILEPILAGVKVAVVVPIALVLREQAAGLVPGSAELIISCSAILLEMELTRRIYVDVVGGRRFRKLDLTGKVYIVTGSNAGIGFETAKQLVAMGATVVLACRSPDKAKVAKDAIIKATNSNKILIFKLDLCGFDSVRKFVKEFRATKLPLHGLINNAGVMMDERNLTQDGFEMVFTANHLSHFLLTMLLLPELEQTSGRIVNLTSSLYKMSSNGFDFSDVMSVKNYTLFGTYSQSKLANILFTVELQRRLSRQGSKVTCNAVHPGAVRTEVTKNMSGLMQTLNDLSAPILLCLQKTPLQGAYSSIFVATDPSLEGLGGQLFIDSRAYQLAKPATDPVAAEKLWELSETLTGLKK